MFKIIHEKSSEILDYNLTESDHISQFIGKLEKPEYFISTTRIDRNIMRSASHFIIMFELKEVPNRIFWCKLYEYEIVKFALENAKSYIRIQYIAGSFSPTLGRPDIMRSSGIDGYQIHLEFD